MGSLFEGSPQTATSYTTSTSETPKWLQDAIFNQIAVAQNLANKPYESYGMPTVAELSPLQQQAYSQVQGQQGAWKPGLTAAQTGTQALTTAPGAGAIANPYLTQAVGTSASSAAQPYMTQAGQTSVSDIGSYMNPYTQNVTDQIAKLGARNLSENLLPGVSDAFVRAGGFGGTRMGEFGSRALRDTQESVLGQQSQALQAGYGQALGASQADLARQAQLASTAGNLAGTQQQALLSAAQQAGTFAGSDLTRQQSALGQLAQMVQQSQQMGYADTAALEAAGQAQQGQQQAQLTAAQQQWLNEQNYPKSQMDWLSTQVRGMAPLAPTSTTQAGSTIGATYGASPLSQLASGLSAGAALYNMR